MGITQPFFSGNLTARPGPGPHPPIREVKPTIVFGFRMLKPVSLVRS